MQFTLFRYYCGAFVTSLEMSGFSISVLKLSSETRNVILDCLDSPAEALGWTPTNRMSLGWTGIRTRYQIASLALSRVRQGCPSPSQIYGSLLTGVFLTEAQSRFASFVGLNSVLGIPSLLGLFSVKFTRFIESSLAKFV